MAGEPTRIGPLPWDRDELIAELAEFAALYAERPVEDNAGGMRAPHLFAIWQLLRKLQPEAIVESGVWLGQGTWFFEQTCPDAQLYCIDPNLERIRYRSRKAQYFDRDFGSLDWDHLPPAGTLLFFDDHQNAFERVKQAHALGLPRMVFEDNYPPGVGDCYSLKKAFAHAGFEPPAPSGGLKQRLTRALGLAAADGRVAPNADDAAYLHRELGVYHEFPPVLKPSHTRWGDLWDERYPTPEPLLREASEPHHAVFEREAKDYTWLCYAELTGRSLNSVGIRGIFTTVDGDISSPQCLPISDGCAPGSCLPGETCVRLMGDTQLLTGGDICAAGPSPRPFGACLVYGECVPDE